MSITKPLLTSLHFALLSLACVSSVLAAEQAPAQPPPWAYWHPMPWLGFGWIFPLMFVVMMVVMFVFMIRGGGMGHMWHHRMMDHTYKRTEGERTETAVEILNKRCAKGEIDKQEYEEKLAAITRSR